MTTALSAAPPTTRRSRRAATSRGRTAPAGRRATRVLRGAQRLVLNPAAVLGGVSIVVAVACLLLGVRPAVVVSGSMAPGIPVGSLTVARTLPADRVEVGDVVTVPRTTGQGLVTHRVIETAPGPDAGSTTLRLQGDANAEPDALPYVVTEAGQVLGTIPSVGYAVLWLQQHLLAAVAALLAVFAFVAYPTRESGS